MESARNPKRDSVYERRRGILKMLSRNGYTDVSALAHEFAVSEHTIRRDLRSMEREALVKRTWGGAVFLGFQYQDDEVSYLAEKQRIAKAVAAMLRPGETICIDAGSTTLEVARCLPAGISVLTNAVNIAYEVAKAPRGINVTLTGGSVIQGDDIRLGLSGPIAIESMRNSKSVSKAILGSLAINLDNGVTEPWHYIAEVKREMIRVAQEVILVCDASKIGKRFLEVVCPVSAIDIFVTDSRIDDSFKKELELRGVKVVVV